MDEIKEEKIPKKRGRPVKSEDPVLSDKEDVLLMEKQKKANTTDQGTVSLSDIQTSLTNLFSKFYPANSTKRESSFYNIFNSYNPFLQNTRLKMISSLPNELEGEKLYAALQAPQFHEHELRGASWALSATQYLYYKIIREAADVPLCKHFLSVPYLDDPAEYSSPSFIKELKFVEQWVNVFDIPNTIKRVLLETKREGKSTYVFRQSIKRDPKGDKVNYVSWQKLPTEYVKLTAIGEHGYVASFNLLIFMNPAFLPSQYPDYIQAIWNEMVNQKAVVESQEQGTYNINFNQLQRFSFDYQGETIRGVLEKQTKEYMFWVQLPQDLCFTFASDTSNAWAVPDTIGLFSALQELTDYSVLAGLIASSPLTAILTGQAETCANAQPGQDQTVLSPSNMMAFQNAFNEMVSGNIQAFFGPFKDLKLQSLPDIPNASSIKTSAVQDFISVAGEGGIIAATDKPSVAMIKGAQLMAASQSDFVVRQCETMLNVLLNKWCGLQHTWKINIWGDIYSFENSVKSLKEMVLAGAKFLLPKLASAHNFSLLDLSAMEKFLEVNQIGASLDKKNNSSTGGTVGRPPLDEGEIENDNSAASIDAGTNKAESRVFEHSICAICGNELEEDAGICAQCREEFGLEEEFYEKT